MGIGERHDATPPGGDAQAHADCCLIQPMVGTGESKSHSPQRLLPQRRTGQLGDAAKGRLRGVQAEAEVLVVVCS